MADLIKLGEVIHEARIDSEYSLSELSRVIEVSQSYISRIESGKRKPSVTVLSKLAIELDLDIKDLMQLAGLTDKAQEAYFDLDQVLKSDFVYMNNKMLSPKERHQLLSFFK
ncbi:helix-turn-helix domain-containing protein [Lysinibacillus sp. UGB7]|uniref:helix-turn-helix domain-containing protein n=1 Tax=Lysinibacillus sp. UGB7 TaxID=3411039 RepID=UPI003B784EC4